MASNSTTFKHRLQDYLSNKITATDEPTYIKSRHIAADLDESAKRVGIAMARLEDDASTSFIIQRRGGNSDGTTWYIERLDS